MAQVPGESPRAEMVAPENGRVVIPMQLRRAVGIEPGEDLVLYVEDGRLVIEPRQHLMDRTRRDFAARAPGADLAAELITDRREEAAREAHE